MIKPLIAILLSSAILLPQDFVADRGGEAIDPIVTGSKVSPEQHAAWQARRDAMLNNGAVYQEFP